MIVDAHAHAWPHWPYDPALPEQGLGSIEMLRWEMAREGVSAAVVVAATVEPYADNNDYVGARSGAGLHAFADLDSVWSATYHQPGAAFRLESLTSRYRFAGVSHYLAGDNDGWLRSAEAAELCEHARARRLVVNLGISPVWFDDLGWLLTQFPDVVFLLNHMGGVLAARDRPGAIEHLAALARRRNLFVKFSALDSGTPRPWDFPYPEAIAAARQLYAAFGASRLCWGSNYPACLRGMTYRQSLEGIRWHCDFIASDAMDLILGGNLAALLRQAASA